MKLTTALTRMGFNHFGFSSFQPRPYTGKPYEQIRAERAHIAPVYTHYYKDPFFPV